MARRPEEERGRRSPRSDHYQHDPRADCIFDNRLVQRPLSTNDKNVARCVLHQSAAPGPAIDGPPVGSAMILGLSKQQFQSMWARVFALYPGAEDLRMTDRYLEDFAVGQTYGSGRFQIDEKRIKSFASEFDPQPFHLDAAAAQRTMFQGLVAS